jgi:hypothetical protein
MRIPMKNDYTNGADEISVSDSVGYHFSPFRRRNRLWMFLWHREKPQLTESRRRELICLYYAGTLLMALGFMICLNAVYRVPVAGQATQAAAPAPIEAVGAAPASDPGLTVLKERGD